MNYIKLYVPTYVYGRIRINYYFKISSGPLFCVSKMFQFLISLICVTQHEAAR